MIHLYRNLKENGDLYDLISACPKIAKNHSNMLAIATSDVVNKTSAYAILRLEKPSLVARLLNSSEN
jgi:hypothetical protein